MKTLTKESWIAYKKYNIFKQLKHIYIELKGKSVYSNSEYDYVVILSETKYQFMGLPKILDKEDIKSNVDFKVNKDNSIDFVKAPKYVILDTCIEITEQGKLSFENYMDFCFKEGDEL